MCLWLYSKNRVCAALCSHDILLNIDAAGGVCRYDVLLCTHSYVYVYVCIYWLIVTIEHCAELCILSNNLFTIIQSSTQPLHTIENSFHQYAELHTMCVY